MLAASKSLPYGVNSKFQQKSVSPAELAGGSAAVAAAALIALFGIPALPTVLTQAQTVEAAGPPRPETQRNPLNRSDAIWIQDRLHDLGYLSGNADRVWDDASRNALHDFKSVNGLSLDDRWDKEAEQLLLSGDGIRANHTFIGRWASDIGQCRQDRASIAITSRAAETGSAKCDFRSVTRQVAGRWRVTAMCSAGRNSWNANLQLKLIAPNLTWDRILGPAKEFVHNGKHTDIEYARLAEDLMMSTEQGTGRYVRCPEP
jgi:hypothetical protein